MYLIKVFYHINIPVSITITVITSEEDWVETYSTVVVTVFEISDDVYLSKNDK